jgi:aminoglycoside phosphotransferase (APT) family kinase protein
MRPAEAVTLPAEFRDWLVEAGFAPADQPLAAEPLTGGVSSDIWRVDLPSGSHCVKRALPRLKVAAIWEAPVERNAHEAAWLRHVNQIDPRFAPRCIANDEHRGMLLMPFLPPGQYRSWKTQLVRGEAQANHAHEVGRRLATIHACAALEPALATRFDHTPLFEAIRIEPYLLATARRHPDLSEHLLTLAEQTRRQRHTLVHGDVSPTPILIGPEGPVLLDAECAWWGDPAFDAAFCLNHLLLKRLWAPEHGGLHAASFSAWIEGYRQGLAEQGGGWEAWPVLERRIAALLPALALARVDGKSPVEYLTQPWQIERVRTLARSALITRAMNLDDINRQWSTAS